MLLRPGRRLGIDPAVAQQHLRDAMAGVHQIPPARVMRADQLPGGLHRRRGTTTGSERPRDQTPREQLGVLAIGLHPITSPPRRQPWRDHLHPDPRRDRRPVKPVPRRPSLIARPHGPGQRLEPVDRRLDPGPEPHPRQLPRHHIDRRGIRRPGVDIEPDISHRSGHGRTSSTHLGVSRSHSPARQTPARSVRPLSPAGNPCNGPPTPYGLARK